MTEGVPHTLVGALARVLLDADPAFRSHTRSDRAPGMKVTAGGRGMRIGRLAEFCSCQDGAAERGHGVE